MIYTPADTFATFCPDPHQGVCRCLPNYGVISCLGASRGYINQPQMEECYNRCTCEMPATQKLVQENGVCDISMASADGNVCAPLFHFHFPTCIFWLWFAQRYGVFVKQY
jgi:hypothetical protein